MDAPHDRDIELQRVSSDFIEELKVKLPPLLWKPTQGKSSIVTRQPRRWAQSAKTDKLISLLEPFQEWPQLLDPHLQGILSQLTEAFLGYLVVHRGQDAAATTPTLKSGTVYPLPRAICKIIYTLCKVRGVKVITRFLNNEPKYLEPMLSALIVGDAVACEDPLEIPSSSSSLEQPLVWEERYVMIQWLSHLLLAPFDLSSLSSGDVPILHDRLSELPGLSDDMPRVALSALSIALKYITLPGKEREAASALLARLGLRLDMQRLGLLDVLIKWAFNVLHPAKLPEDPSIYAYIGVLSFIARLGSSAQAIDLAPFVVAIFDKVLDVSQRGSIIAEIIGESAVARKMIIKILRSMTALALSLDGKSNGQIEPDSVSRVVEDAVDHFLVSLADKDTPVRFAASKALSVTTLKLDSDMASDVVEAVLGSLAEDVLFEKRDGSLISRFEAQSFDPDLVKRNISAVDPQRWHGLILTLGHLLFRRSLPPNTLTQVLQSLLLGLDFEQRSSTGSSIGTNVRDASCFGIWSVARKYTTDELSELDIREVKIGANKDTSVLQILAVELVCAASLDPSGNIRRGASAALQELVGRHPNMILEGISLVQIVDYHAVARRSRAMLDVARDAARLGSVYWGLLLDGLLQWRGIASPDSRSRRVAASAIGELSVQDSYRSILKVLRQSLGRLASLPASAIDSRHGCLISLSAIVDAFLVHLSNQPDRQELDDTVAAEISQLWEIFDWPIGPSEQSLTLSQFRPDLTAEASALLISSLARSCVPVDKEVNPVVSRPPSKLLQRATQILMLCVSRADETVIEVSSEAASDLFMLLSPDSQMEIIQQWFDNIHAGWKAITGRGQIAALGTVFKRIPASSEGRFFIRNELLRSAGEEEKIAKRVSAVKCLATGVLPCIDDVESLSDNIQTFLNDYTTDRRGDIGSSIRLEAINAVVLVLKTKLTPGSRPTYVYDLMKCVVRLSAEKMDKVRLEAWKCLQAFWESAKELPELEQKYDHFSEVSSPQYFLQLFKLLQVDWARLSLVKGLVTSASVGTENLVRASRFAFVQYMNELDDQIKKKLEIKILEDLISILDNAIDDDRYAIPLVDIISFFLDNCFNIDSPDVGTRYRRLFLLVQKFHYRSTNIPRLEAAIKVYAVLWRVESLRNDATKKMTSMLLHSYPMVRSAASECLFMETGNTHLKEADWTLSPRELKPRVDWLRQVLIMPIV